VEVSRLLDMPMQTKMLSGDLKQYRVRVFDEEDYEVGRTQELAGLVEGVQPGPEVDTETIRLGPEGRIKLLTDSQVIFLQVEYAGGFVGNTKIGRCRIHRGDPRSSQVWSYVLSNRHGDSVGSGIELKVVEGVAPMVPPAPSGDGMQQSFHTIPAGSFGPPPLPGPVGSGVMNSLNEPSFNTMPFNVTSFSKGPPIGMDKGKGKGKGKDFKGSFKGMGKEKGKGKGKFEEPSWQTMPPLDDMQHFDYPKVDSAVINDRDLTELMNNLIDSNGFRDPTGGRPARDVFREDGLLEVKKGNKEPLRFAQNWPPPYDLSPLFVQPAHPSFHTMPPMNPIGPPNSMGGLPPTAVPPGSMGALPPTAMPPGSMGMLPQQGHAPVVAVVELDKLTGLPSPPRGEDKEVILTLHRDGREIDKKGPFKTENMGNYRTVSCHGTVLIGKCSMQDLAKGGVEVVVRANYRDTSIMSSFIGSGLEKIGDTFPIKVTWKPESAKNQELWTEKGQAVGGVFCAHRLARETDVRPMTQTTQARSGSLGRSTGGFRNPSPKPKKSPVEVKAEAAANALEAQNRAFLQRIKIADPDTYVDNNNFQWTNEKGYREWKDLDSLFITMGPNYVAQSNEIGPNICRVYEDDTSIWRELMQKDQSSPEALNFGGKDQGGQDHQTKLKLIKTVYPGDPEKVQSTLRPLICRDREDIKYDNQELSGAPVPQGQQPVPVKVTIKRAVRLRTQESFLVGSVKPKVIVEVPGKPQTRLETRVSPDHHSPEWNQILDIFGWQRGDDLKFTVAEDGWLGFDAHLGEFKLKTGDFYPEPFRGEVPLTGSGRKGNQRVGKDQAKLAVEVRVLAAGEGSKTWPPPNPMYAPVQNLNQADQETQRLANWDPVQCAKLPFADVNPNYKINEDIWGAMADSKATNELLLPKPPGWRPVRVKDSCLMA